MSEYSKIHIFCEAEEGLYITGDNAKIDANGAWGQLVVQYYNKISNPFALPYEINSVDAEEKLLNTLILRSAKRRIKASEKMDLWG